MLFSSTNQTSNNRENVELVSPLINPASKGPANHVSELSISHLTPGITKDGEVLQPKKFPGFTKVHSSV